MSTQAEIGWAQAAMIHYSQSDKRWADFQYAPGYPMLEFGCLLTSIAMVGSLYYGEGITPLLVAQVLKDDKAFNDGMLARPGALSIAWPRLTYGGRTDWLRVSADLDDLQQELDNFGATVILVKWCAGKVGPIGNNTHFVVLTEISLRSAQIVDSWDGETKELLKTQYSGQYWSAGRAIYGVRRFRVTPTEREKDHAKRNKEYHRFS